MSGVCILEFRGHSTDPYSLVFSSNGASLASAMADSSICVWDAAGGTHRLTLQGPISPVRSMLFSPKGTLLVSTPDNASFSIWDVVNGELKATLKGNAVAFSPDDKYIASISTNATICLWDTLHWQGRELSPPDQVPVDVPSLWRSQAALRSETGGMLINVTGSSTGAMITSISPLPREAFESNRPFYSVHVDENRVYVMKDGRKMTLCWLPDYYKHSALEQYHDYAFLGGKSGEILFVNVKDISYLQD